VDVVSAALLFIKNFPTLYLILGVCSIQDAKRKKKDTYEEFN